jgi:ATP-dependent helicase YprA (DUF1998 family)
MLNPVLYTEKVIGDFLKYQLTAYPFADENLFEQMSRLLNLEQTRNTPLFQGSYVSLSRAFRQGVSIEQLITEKVFHPHLNNLIPHAYLYGHQEQAIRAISQGLNTLVSTGTGSGKTECFLYPIISHSLNLKDNNAPEGITAIIVYPMNALAEDQLGRLRGLLAGTGISFGMYVGKTPEKTADVTGKRLKAGASKRDYEKAIARIQQQKQAITVYPPEERPSREEQRKNPPRILLTNIKQLELLLTRQKDIELFKNVQLKYLVFDEAHTFSGAVGAETACLIRRLKAFCQYQNSPESSTDISSINQDKLEKKSNNYSPICIATSATITDINQGQEIGKDFAAKFFGIDREQVKLVGEEYQDDLWANQRTLPPCLPGDIQEHLKNVLEVLEEAETQEESGGKQIKVLVKAMTGQAISSDNWRESLYNYLCANQLVYQINQGLRHPRLLKELVADLNRQNRDRLITDTEILIWLALGSASRKQNRPLLRPVFHGFVRGVSGAVVTFEPLSLSDSLPSANLNQNINNNLNQQPIQRNRPQPKLWLSAEDTIGTNEQGLYVLKVSTCTTCGQHYFIHHCADFRFTENTPEPQGGQAYGTRLMWQPLGEELGGDRLLLLDRQITDDEDELITEHPDNLGLVHFCRYCGTLHSSPLQRHIPSNSNEVKGENDQNFRIRQDRCDHCGSLGDLIPLYVVKQKENQRGKLTGCITCDSRGRTGVGGIFREPIKEVRAIAVSDVHVLAQNMIHHSSRRRLLVFADNRQDAAFQAGWMQDHARRYRLRSLMYEKINQGSISIGDLTAYLDDLLDQDDDLSRSLIPEVWRTHRKEAEGVRHNEERRYFLRISILREITTGVKQRIGLEPWGRLKVDYGGLSPDLDFIQRWSNVIGIEPQILTNGIEALLDITRRKNIVLDRVGEIFGKFWQEGDREIQRGYMPILQGVPIGLKLQREVQDNQNRVQQWLSQGGQTVAMQSARNWGVDPDLIPEFLGELWNFLTETLAILVPVTLKGARNRPLANFAGVHQIDADKLRLTAHQGVYRCQVCRRTHLRLTPNNRCMAYRCDGEINFEPEREDDYDLMVLDQQFSMIRAREHSAQVPTKDREVIETMFKSKTNEQINTLVCTPTLEMGVDIGSLDAVLMRNVPPLPANYWQRVGRAGRQHRMAVNLTYCRQASHDRAYFQEPLKLLQGMITPPRFNLQNPVMLRKHVHAVIITALHQLTTQQNYQQQIQTKNCYSVSAEERENIKTILKYCFPHQVKSYLFNAEGLVLPQPLDVTSLQTLVNQYQLYLEEQLKTVFCQDLELQNSISLSQLSIYLQEITAELTSVIKTLWRRLQWAITEMDRLDNLRRKKGTLDADEEALRRRCDRLIKKLKGIQTRQQLEAEGYDDSITYSVLASEGFLPGYGLETGAILGTAQVPRILSGFNDFELPRPTAMALREYIPGNLIYANSHRFIPRYYHLEPQRQLTQFQVDREHEAIVEVGESNQGIYQTLTMTNLRGIPLCDVDLAHQSSISDEEIYRFQLPVSIMGYELERHNGGKVYQWQDNTLLFRKGLHLRLVNIGTANRVSQGLFGYPLCTVCGYSRSPLSSDAEITNFREQHRERCGNHAVQDVGFFTDVVADSLTLRDCQNRTEAYSIAEAIRYGASRILEMELDDLQLVCIGQAGQENVDIIIYDPMPGGSGLLTQIIEQWTDIISSALATVTQCPSACETACIDCLFTYRNSFYHRFLDRHIASNQLNQLGSRLNFNHDIPPQLPQTDNQTQQPVNDAEKRFKDLLLRAGFSEPIAQHSIDLGLPLGTTTPDFFYQDPNDIYDGICIYLDGLSQTIHGNSQRQKIDKAIEDELENLEYKVFRIPVSALSDRTIMTDYLYRLGRVLLGKEQAKKMRENTEWFH